MPVQGTFLPERGANGDMSVSYCATDWCLKMEASPTGHECSSIWAWMRACCLTMAPFCHAKRYLAKSTSWFQFMARFPAEPKNDPIPSTICFISMELHHISHLKQLQWRSSCSWLSIHKTLICLKNTVQWHGETFVTSTFKRLVHTTLHGCFEISLHRNYVMSRDCVFPMSISEWVILLRLRFWWERIKAFYNSVVLKFLDFTRPTVRCV